MPSFIIHGGKKLKGIVRISGSKNAALPILAATLLTDEQCIIKNVPDIEDVHTMLAILKSLGSKVEFKNHTVRIHTPRITNGKVLIDSACKMRASVLLLGPLLARMHHARMPYPGGCILGARPIDTHIEVFQQLGIVKIPSAATEIILSGTPQPTTVILPEFSVTATENAFMAAALSRGTTEVRLAALEPHVVDLCVFLKKMGVKIDGVGTHTVRIGGGKRLRGATHSIIPDYLETGTFALAAVLTGGDVKIQNIVPGHLDAFWNLLREMKVLFVLGKNSAHILPSKNWRACKRLQTNVFPGFPTDLQPPFAILLTQAKGISRIHETLFEGRFNYFSQLQKIGAHIEKLNPHEAIVKGPTPLYGGKVKSWDIRAGAAMILAGLIAKGKTTVSDIHYIDRGYERFDEKLRLLGAEIIRAVDASAQREREASGSAGAELKE